MKKFIATWIVSICLGSVAAPTFSSQQEDNARHSAGSAHTSDMTAGVVRKVNKEANKITLRHGPIKNLDMPPMTMVFRVKDPFMLDKVKAGDKVQFTAEDIGGALTVTAIEAVK